jgi:hypothetical protein
MRAVRALIVSAIAAGALAGCGGSSQATRTATTETAPTTTVAAPAALSPSFASARARTTGAGPVQFRLVIKAIVGGSPVVAEENGTVSFVERRAHLYKQIPGSTVPQELVLLGPFTYTNANVQAALADPTVKPWTKLDTRRLTAKQLHAQPDEFAHVVAPAYLPDGVAQPKRSGVGPNGTTRFTGVVDPARLARRIPAAVRVSIVTAVRNDYSTTPFPATFWLDAGGRVRRVRVAYTTAQGSQITVDTSYSSFGTKIDVRLPAAGDITDITP